MPIIGVSITKETAFRDSVQPFSNMYFFNNGVGSVPDVAAANGIIDALVAIEKTFHSSLVTFTFARLWHQTLLQVTTEMIHQKALSGVGTSGTVSGMDKERAHLFRWRAGSDSRGRPVYLRKWYHSCGQFPGSAGAYGTGILDNTTGFTSGQRSSMADNAAAVEQISAGGGPWNLCAKSGRDSDVSTPVSHPYLEHHQLGDQWRGA